MKRISITSLTVGLLTLALAQGVFANDLIIDDAHVSLSTQTLIEGKSVRVYATVRNEGTSDLLGFVRFLSNNSPIGADQPISVVAGKDDTVFVDWSPVPGPQNLRVTIVSFDGKDQNPNNNEVSKAVSVLADTDRDGVPNINDDDDDNDGVPDAQDAFPLNKNEWLDSDGDGVGDNADPDDDNDGTPDELDNLPLNANEVLDNDKDGVGDNQDPDDDNDGWSDIEEVAYGTDPFKADTDGDGVNDPQDLFPLDPSQTLDTDGDGISDERDLDADNDGIPKDEDVDDSNQGPDIVIDSEGTTFQRIAFVGDPIRFETGNSRDPDGEITKVEWKINGISVESKGAELQQSFAESGRQLITVKLTDDKGESREKEFAIYVITPTVPWISLLILLLLVALAIWGIVTYSKRRPTKAAKRSKNS
ncbi:hypothetical protein CO046_03160 [Candidatus Peregrinibacteria bacterium CG_4_9_14_0_2_um_filter_53_11]|nr:MAG: hypothetical protein CO046_03160 [Candidatus Peregrinibacteria bacterium CG_4_9_14_0_2_um_filter_53_11]